MKRGKGEPGKTKRYDKLAQNVKSASAQKKQVSPEPIPRISMDKIQKIYDEYGFVRPDARAVQEKLPNDEQKMRKILDVHRKMHDEEIKTRAAQKIADMKYRLDLHKQNQKNHLTAMKNAAKAAKNGGMDGTGGPGMPMPQQMPKLEQPIPGPRMPDENTMPPGLGSNQSPLDVSNAGKAFFVGEFGLVKLVNPGVVADKSPIWLVDVKNKVLRPFMSQKAFDTYFGASQEAYDAVTILPTDAISDGGVLEDYKMLNSDHGVRDDGTMKPLEHSPAMLSRRYGKPQNRDAENKAILALDGMLRGMSSQSNRQPGAQPPPQGGQDLSGGQTLG